MLALTFTAKDEVALVERSEPDVPAGHARLSVAASGLCHTDVEVLRGGYGPGTYPLVPGHEYCGVVTRVGDGVEAVRLGDRVVVDPNLPCGACRACGAGRTNLCPDLGAYGVTVDGGFAEQSVVAADKLIPVGTMPAHRAALAEPLGCVLNGLEAALASAPVHACIFGAGPIGQLLALALAERGTAAITLVDPDPARRAIAEGLGFGTADVPDAKGDDFTRAFDFAADASGVPEVMERLPDRLVDGGAGLIMGVAPPRAQISLAPHALFRRQLRLAGSHSLTAAHMRQAMAMLDRVGDRFDRIVTHRLPLTEMAAVLRHGPPAGGLKLHFASLERS